jgi:predicted nucleic acid-binding protein
MRQGNHPTSPGSLLFVLDNAAISSLYEAGALDRVLELWPGRWIVPIEVQAEAEAWPTEGPRLRAALDSLASRHVIVVTSIDPRREGTLYAQLAVRLGAGESAAITIAHHRGNGVVLDDRTARRICQGLRPTIPCIATEEVLRLAVFEGLLTLEDARAIWRATGITDPKRQIL